MLRSPNKDPSGQLTGLDGEMMQWIAKKNGWTIEIVGTDFATLIQTVKTKKADIVVDAMYITDERNQQVSFTDEWYTEGEGIVVPVDSTIKSREDVKGKVIGAQTGTFYAKQAANWGGKEIKYFDSQAALLKAVENRQVEVIVTDSIVAAYSLKQNPNDKIKLVSPYTPEEIGHIGAAVRPEDGELLQQMNDGLKALKASPDYATIMKKYGVPETNYAK
ncbi:amino acid ABC transporter substrate-binding protein [Enemella dayhoffiae]|uniref:Amino acid ABC transporter substrate-binding protein n=1 Tax=Enemella dayhoffiae TaxID=2016507 RepID=A0A255H627_9ACTN|nr:transporter substrate-binding domain-containing protein [Enemella dayhoffiae]OYO22084.1 amino acid ABC transporter substrate-binding protein [Enemella dayhoffiae]